MGRSVSKLEVTHCLPGCIYQAYQVMDGKLTYTQEAIPRGVLNCIMMGLQMAILGNGQLIANIVAIHNVFLAFFPWGGGFRESVFTAIRLAQ